MPRNIDLDILKLFGPAGTEALIKALLIQLNILRVKVGLDHLEYDTFIQAALADNSEIVIPKER